MGDTGLPLPTLLASLAAVAVGAALFVRLTWPQVGNRVRNTTRRVTGWAVARWQSWVAERATERAQWRTLDADHAAVSARWDTTLEPTTGGMPVTAVPRLVHTGPAVPASVVLPVWPVDDIDDDLAAMWANLGHLAAATSLAVEAIPLAVTHV
jgi:hypothetical protein